MKISTINRFFNVAFGALAMIAVALFSAYLAMRIAIHGREVEVPTLAGLTLLEAGKKAGGLGLRLNIENRFYAPNSVAGTVLSQSPAPKSVVRRDWTVRVTESLGPQQVSIPNLIGQSERPATIAIRRLGLEVGAIAHIASPGPAGIVLAQTPNPSDTPAASPRISLLLSAPQPAVTRPVYTPTPAAEAQPTAAPVAVAVAPPPDPTAPSIAMPSLAGLSLSAAVARASAAGLHIVSIEEAPAPATPTPAEPPSTAAPATPQATVVSQSPAAGHRVQPGAGVKVTLGH
ncbi:MAG: domain containing protein [Acidobacteriaceae bacterium]|nr:domain containing protein [Acidobacteriaceae bacterium]